MDNVGYFGLVLIEYVYFILLICCYFDLLLYCVIKYLIEKGKGNIRNYMEGGGYYYKLDDID